MYSVYILECADATLYIGCTNDIDKRIHAHNHGKNGARYTKARRPVVLRYIEAVGTKGKAQSREAALKRLSRADKLALCKKARARMQA
jgi:predicted GIY-YIG superfamily endonuclease